MAPASKSSHSADDALQAAIDGDLRRLKKMATKVNLRDAKDAMGRNALHCAAGKGHLDICRFLVEELGLDVNSTADGSGTSVHFAAVGGDERVLGYLLDHGGDPGAPDAKGSTPLHDAAEQGHCKAVRLLLSKGVDVDPVNHRGTPLHLAAAKDRDQVVKILLEHGADPNKVVNHVFSPLMMACCGHSLKCVKLLVKDAALAGNRLADAKSQGKEAFAKGDYVAAIYFYCLAMEKDPLDATLLANRSLCWLRLGEGDRALLDAQQCRMMSPHWSKAWYREGAALSLLKDYKGAVDAFVQALKLDPASEEIRKALRQMFFLLPSISTFKEAMDALKSAVAPGRVEQQNS
ncbi:hypothetical protein EJB05_49383 [Eragrostis curvula]|uniref:Serine/threonine-protein kinase BSK1-like TPR repeats domain-containing protein n=1 Tax=Eragrostis curvula TaxID=38414 RepID=A0A5J9T4K7_9POAL|nr:hypothetical protein EJB05_49383 [Eragrostis curvula]